MKKILFLIILISVIGCSGTPESKSGKPAGEVPGNLEGNFKLWAETPPMGWNSYNSYGAAVAEKEVKANADYMAKILKSEIEIKYKSL